MAFDGGFKVDDQNFGSLSSFGGGFNPNTNIPSNIFSGIDLNQNSVIPSSGPSDFFNSEFEIGDIAGFGGGDSGLAGIFSDIGGIKGIGDLLGGFGSIGQALLGSKALGQAEDQFDFQKDFANRNLSNQAQTINTRLEDRQRARVGSEGLAPGEASKYEGISSYVANNRVDGSPIS